jgi:hypothetical protein
MNNALTELKGLLEKDSKKFSGTVTKVYPEQAKVFVATPAGPMIANGSGLSEGDYVTITNGIATLSASDEDNGKVFEV